MRIAISQAVRGDNRESSIDARRAARVQFHLAI
jgi:hypothetical protein